MADAKGYLLPDTVTNKFSIQGLLNTINPASGLYSSTPDYVPGWLIKAFSSGGKADSEYERNAGPAKAAHILAKVIAGGAVFGGAAWLLRSFMHSLDIDNVENIKASARASRKLETTKARPTDPAITYKAPAKPKEPQQKKLQEQEPLEKKQSYEFALGAIPPLTAIAAILASFKLADKTYDLALGNRLDKELSAAKSQSQDLALNRVLRNRGIEQAPQEDLVTDAYANEMKAKAKARPKKKQEQIKVASMNKSQKVIPQGLESALGLALAAMFVTGSVVGFNWHRGNSAAMAKYKAQKRGLETYNKERALSENIESTPLDPEFLEYLDTNLPQAKKNAPAQSAETSLHELMI